MLATVHNLYIGTEHCMFICMHTVFIAAIVLLQDLTYKSTFILVSSAMSRTRPSVSHRELGTICLHFLALQESHGIHSLRHT